MKANLQSQRNTFRTLSQDLQAVVPIGLCRAPEAPERLL